MTKNTFASQFSTRLYEAMMQAGFNSTRSTAGVDIHKLVEITGYSPQICRKYLRGEAIPEPNKLHAIANALKVSPGWLLFGEGHDNTVLRQDRIDINKINLRLLFLQLKSLYNSSLKIEEIADFLVDLTEDLSQMQATEAQLTKIITLAINSAMHFKID